MKSQQESAAFFKRGLRLGTHSVGEIIEWADSCIAECDSPSSDLIDLAMMAKSNPIDVEGKLGQLAGDIGHLEVAPAVLAAAHKVLLSDPSFGPVLARGLYALYVDCGYDVPDCLKAIAGFDDEYALAKQGIYGTEEDVYNQLLSFAASFDDAA